MDTGQFDRTQLREQVRRLINTQREFNEQVQRLAQETRDVDIQKTLEEISSRGQENIQRLIRLLAVKCTS